MAFPWCESDENPLAFALEYNYGTQTERPTVRDTVVYILAALMQGVANFLAMILAFIILAFIIGTCSWIAGFFRRRTS